MPAKRKNTSKQASNGNAKQAKQDGQKAVSHEINVPIDEGFKEGKLWSVLKYQLARLHIQLGYWRVIYHALNDADRPNM